METDCSNVGFNLFVVGDAAGDAARVGRMRGELELAERDALGGGGEMEGAAVATTEGDRCGCCC